jgi:hypothetical protein
MNFKVAGQWCLPQKLVSGEVDYIINQLNFFPHLIRARNDPIFGKTGRIASSKYCLLLSTRWLIYELQSKGSVVSASAIGIR